jgi:hypothetical protein
MKLPFDNANIPMWVEWLAVAVVAVVLSLFIVFNI